MWKELTKRLKSTDSLVSLLLGLAVILVLGVLTFNYFSKRREGTKQATPEKTAAGVPVALPTVHETTTGETLWGIGQKYYNSGYNWVDIQKVNNLTNPDYIEAGQKLTIPDVKPIVPEGQISAAVTAALKPKDETYTVVSGDNLWSIATREYNDGFRWVNIAKANNLANPDLIHPGNILKLPTIP